MATLRKVYSEVIKIPTFEERFRYLKLGGRVGDTTFGPTRYLNQEFYRSDAWKRFRRDMIIRDNGCDLAMDDGMHGIYERIMLHHLNPVKPEDLIEYNIDILLNPENVICVSFNTHEAIHYSDESILSTFVERTPNDTIPWHTTTR